MFSDFASVPRTDRLIKGHGFREHVFHVNDCWCDPRINWLIETGRLVEHLAHCLHTCCVPRALALSKRTLQILFNLKENVIVCRTTYVVDVRKWLQVLPV